MSNMQAIDLLILFDDDFIPFVPANLHVWIDNLDDVMVDNNGNKIVFNVP